MMFRKDDQFKLNYCEFIEKFEKKISKFYFNDYSNLVFLCIGTNRLVGDSIGPIVGNSLKNMENEYMQIYGTIENNINFLNAKETIEEIYYNFEKPFLVTVDAALSQTKNKGDIVLSEGYMKIGKALQKSICFYSDVNIKCVVGKSYLEKERNLKELKNMTLEESKELAEIISNGIKKVIKKSNIHV